MGFPHATLFRPVTPLALQGSMLLAEDGQEVFLKGATFFAGIESDFDGDGRWLTVLDELTRYGANMVREFGMFKWINQNEYNGKRPFDPRRYDRLQQRWEAHFLALKQRGFYSFVALGPDNRDIMPEDDLVKLWHQFIEVADSVGNVLCEPANERTAHSFNDVTIGRYRRPKRALACSGGYSDAADEYDEGRVIEPVWDFGSLHPKREAKAGVLDCCAYDNPYFKTRHVGLIIGEPIRYGSNSSNPELGPRHAQHAASAARAGAMGWVFHSRNGVRLEPFDADTRPFVEAVFRGAYGGV